MSWLIRRILGRSRRERIRNEVTRKELGQKDTIIDRIRKRRLTRFGHVTRMDDRRLPTTALYGHVEGTRSRGRQTKTWMENVMEDLKIKDINIREAVDKTRDRTLWRVLLKPHRRQMPDGGEKEKKEESCIREISVFGTNIYCSIL